MGHAGLLLFVVKRQNLEPKSTRWPKIRTGVGTDHRRMSQIRALRRVASILTTPHTPEDFLGLVNPIFSSRQLRGVVTRVVRETPDSMTIHFRPGRGWNPHLAGQWARIGVEIDGVRQWRSYSLSTAAGHDPAITVTAMVPALAHPPLEPSSK